MKKMIMLLPYGVDSGISEVAKGVKLAIEEEGFSCSLFQITEDIDRIFLEKGSLKVWIEKFSDQCYSAGTDYILIEGAVANEKRTFAPRVNFEIVEAFQCELIFVLFPVRKGDKELENYIGIVKKRYSHFNQIGYINNKIGAPIDKSGRITLDLFEGDYQKGKALIKGRDSIAEIMWRGDLYKPKLTDIIHCLNPKVHFWKEKEDLVVSHIILAAARVENMQHLLTPHSLIVTSGDRTDIILAVVAAVNKGIKIAGILLTTKSRPEASFWSLCSSALDKGLAVFSVEEDSFKTTGLLQDLKYSLRFDDNRELVEYISRKIDRSWIGKGLDKEVSNLTPLVFRRQIRERAKQLYKTILLPEAEEPRILEAAEKCSKGGLAKFILLGNREKINEVMRGCGINFSGDVEIIDPDECYHKYVEKFVNLRKHKAMTEDGARGLLKNDRMILGAMLVDDGIADALVGGVITPTANVVLPAFQIIKAKEEFGLVSSCFFICLKSSVIVYADCAVNVKPTAKQLALIAIATYKTAMQFGIDPKMAMISYSTKGSGSGEDVTKVNEALEIIRSMDSSIVVDGPIQYDAAIDQDVANIKAPGSEVAGKANICIFPDLNTGNIVYKAVQRSADAVAIGPILQGLNKPINDLSRGASVEDITYTILISALQSDKIFLQQEDLA